MSDVSISTDNWPMAFAIIVIMFYGDPDIADALIHFLMSAK